MSTATMAKAKMTMEALPPTRKRGALFDPVWDAVVVIDRVAGEAPVTGRIDFGDGVGTGSMRITVDGVRYRVSVERVA